MPDPNEQPMLCAYCGTVRTWPHDFPLRTAAHCWECLEREASMNRDLAEADKNFDTAMRTFKYRVIPAAVFLIVLITSVYYLIGNMNEGTNARQDF